MKSSNILSLRDDNAKILLMKGKHTAIGVINSAIEAGEIDESDRQFWEEYDKVDVCYFKAVPKPGYSACYHESSKDVKGAFLATAIMVYW